MILLIESDRKYPKMSEKLPDIVKAIISHDHLPPYNKSTLMIISGKTVLVKNYGVLKGGETS